MQMIPDASTFLGEVAAVSGAAVHVYLAKTISSGLAIIDGITYRVGQVGSFVRVPQGYKDLYGVVTDVGASAAPVPSDQGLVDTGRWLKAQLVGEALGGTFERGISQHPNVSDRVHLVVDADLRRIYGAFDVDQITIGRLASAESIPVRIDLNKLLTRHAAVIGSTGAGKSTTVSSVLRSIVKPVGTGRGYPSARVLMLDIHGEYSRSLGDLAAVFRVEAADAIDDPGYVHSNPHEFPLLVPYWALDASDLTGFLLGSLSDAQRVAIYEKITVLKLATWQNYARPGVDQRSITADTPLPFSLKQLWFDFIEPEVRTYLDTQRQNPALEDEGEAETLTAPRYRPATTLNTAPFQNQSALGLRRQLNQLKSRLLDHKFDFLLHPGRWEPALDGYTVSDVDELLRGWLGHARRVTVLDLSAVPSDVLGILVASILKIIYEAMFWGRNRPEGARARPLLIIMEEAHRYIGSDRDGESNLVVRRIVKEGRKYDIGAMIVSQRPAEIDETILSQCGTFFAMRLSNVSDRARVQAALPDSLAGIVDMLPVLRTGETIIIGESARLPVRCRIPLLPQGLRPDSQDPEVASSWSRERAEEDYGGIAACWRAKDPNFNER